MKYWIIIDNNQIGPLTVEEIAAVNGFGPATPVWYEGLTDWTTAAQVAELNLLIEQMLPAVPPVDETPHTPAPAPAPAPAAMAMPQPSEQTGKPDTYLVWNIVATLACCIPTGIVGIIMSNKVNEAYARGDMQRARKMSERAAWWFMISLVLGLMAMPFQMLMQIAMAQ